MIPPSCLDFCCLLVFLFPGSPSPFLPNAWQNAGGLDGGPDRGSSKGEEDMDADQRPPVEVEVEVEVEKIAVRGPVHVVVTVLFAT